MIEVSFDVYVNGLNVSVCSVVLIERINLQTNLFQCQSDVEMSLSIKITNTMKFAETSTDELILNLLTDSVFVYIFTEHSIFAVKPLYFKAQFLFHLVNNMN